MPHVGIAVDRIPQLFLQKLSMPSVARALRAALVGSALLAAGDAVGLGQEILAYRFNGAPEAKVARAARFHYGGAGLTPDFMDQPRQNQAWLGCRHYTWAFEAEAPVWTGDVPQARAQDDGAAVLAASRTHNTFTFDVDVKRPARILLNSAWDRGWTTDIGAVVENDNKLLAIDLPVGRHQVHARYWPRYLTLGLWMTGVGIAGVLVFFLRHRIARRLARRRQG